jgi:hypothetical protein
MKEPNIYNYNFLENKINRLEDLVSNLEERIRRLESYRL